MAHRQLSLYVLLGLGMTVGFQRPALAGTINANSYAFVTTPGSASINLGPGVGTVLLEGATESWGNGTVAVPLTGGQVTQLNTLAPNLASPAYLLNWSNPMSATVGTTFTTDQIVQQDAPNVSTASNFDTVIQVQNNITLTSGGQSEESPISIIMLDLQNVVPVVIGGFHYNLLVQLTDGPVDPPFTGNLTFQSLSVDGLGDITGTLDLGTTGPPPTSANLGANLPSGMEGLPVDFDIQFIPLDGGPPIPNQSGESIFQNTGPSSFGAFTPEPGTWALMLGGVIGLAGWRRRRD